jgi:protein gp37
MGENSSIEWTDATWNPTRSCTKIAPGCKNCYAERFAERFRGVAGHPYEQGFDPRLAPEQLGVPLSWKKPRKVFVDSMSDLFHEDFPFEYIAACFGVMAACPQHTFQILTKRPARAAEFFQWITDQAEDLRASVGEKPPGGHAEPSVCALLFVNAGGTDLLREVQRMTWPLPNVWIGTSIANQADADKNVPVLLRVPATVRFLSIEPLLGEINFRWTPYAHQATGETYREYAVRNGSVNEYEALRKISWIIVGGESGPGARPAHPDWPRSLRDQCVAAGVSFFFKQHGEWIGVDDMERLPLPAPELSDPQEYFNEHTFLSGSHCEGVHCGATPVYRVGKKKAGRLIDGRTWDQFPISSSDRRETV